MSYFQRLIRRKANETGATAIEYGLIATIIGVAIIAGTAALQKADHPSNPPVVTKPAQ